MATLLTEMAAPASTLEVPRECLAGDRVDMAGPRHDVEGLAGGDCGIGIEKSAENRVSC